jgi:hypothetical protein
MRSRLVLGGLLMAWISIWPAMPVQAGPQCVSYKVTRPGGTMQGNPCSKSFGWPLTQPFSVTDCQWIPPAGVTVCVGVQLYTP